MHSGIKSPYVTPDESKEDARTFRSLCASIKRDQKLLTKGDVELYSKIIDLSNNIKVMRKKAARLNSFFRRSRPIP